VTIDLRGSLTPLITPFREGQVDLDAFEALVERQIAAGSHGVVVTGTTGEPTSLTPAERLSLYERAVAIAGGRTTVVAATGSSNHEETLLLTRCAAERGVDAALVVCPAFVRPSQEGLVAHFTAVARATDLPLLIYNIPGRAGVSIAAESVVRVAESCSTLFGLKHASPDLDLVSALLARLGPQFRVFCGVESLSYPMLAVGAAGLMSAVANLLPAQVAGLCDAVAGGDHGRALRLHRDLFAINQAIFFDTNPVPLKHMLALEGIASAEVRPPLAPLADGVRARVEEALARTTHALAAAPFGS
jgi:4-hydroxy-tetrahydrodipicolinate synthase